jgi:hypothetical protein
MHDRTPRNKPLTKEKDSSKGELSKQIIIAVATVLTTLATSVLTPVGDYLRGLLKQERVQISILADREPIHGRLWPVRIILSPAAVAENSGGIIDVTWAPTDVFCTNERSSMPQPRQIRVEKFGGAIQVPPNRPLQFNVCNDKPFSLTVSYVNIKNQTMTATRSFKVRAAAPELNPARENLSGKWWIRGFDSAETTNWTGTVELEDHGGDLGGKYDLSNGESGNISGHHDSQFDIELRNRGSNYAWQLHSDSLSSKEGFLTLDGTAKRVQFGSTPPKVLQGLKFHGDARALGEIAWEQ